MSWFDEPRRAYASSFVRGDLVAVYVVTFPGLGMPGGYHAIRSLEGFRHRWMRKHIVLVDYGDGKVGARGDGDASWFSLHFDHDFEEKYILDMECLGYSVYDPAYLPWREFDDVKSFFKGVGYDPKKFRPKQRRVRAGARAA